MGDGVSEGEKTDSGAHTYTEVFESIFPQYLMMGMRPHEFWDGDPSLVRAYREAYRLKIEAEDRMADQMAWLQGKYFQDALQSVYLLVNGFVPKNTKVVPYPQKPYLLQEEENKRAEESKKQEEIRKQKEEEKIMTPMAFFQALTIQINKNMEKRKEEKAKKGQQK